MAGDDLFAGIAVSEFGRSLEWYERFFGASPSMLPHETEAVWELGAHRFVYIVERVDRAGASLQLLFVDDLEERVAAIAARGIEPATRETYENGVTRVTYCDPDGNELGLGGAPRADDGVDTGA